VNIPDIEKEKELNIRLNKNTGEFDYDLLANFDEDFLKDIGFDEKELLKLSFSNNYEGTKLTDRFVIPPFSVFDTRQGYWQDRKKEWYSFGFDSSKGRKENLIGHSKISLALSNRNGTSIFDPVLCEVCYKWFNIDNGSILDPFAGGVVRGFVAGYLNYDYYGIDLSEEQIKANEEQIEKLKYLLKIKPKYFIGNSINLDKIIDKNDFDLIFSCPPYFNLEKYTDNPEDLSNLDYEEFKKQYHLIIEKAVKKLKNNRFAIFVVGDVRNKEGIYLNFVDFTKQCFLDAGMVFYNEIILVNAISTASIKANKFMKTRKVVKTHQNVLVFYKGDVKAIKKEFKELDVNIYDKDLNKEAL
jgi:DNA modification methylase